MNSKYRDCPCKLEEERARVEQTVEGGAMWQDTVPFGDANRASSSLARRRAGVASAVAGRRVGMSMEERGSRSGHASIRDPGRGTDHVLFLLFLGLFLSCFIFMFFRNWSL